LQRPGPEDRTDEISPEPSGPPAVSGELARGARVGERERYEVLECIGQGSSASVYRARDRELGRHVAIKLFAKRLVGPARDGFALARFHHENIVTLYDHGEQAGRPLLVLEHVAGETLQERVARGPLGGAEALAIVTQVAHALVHAHANGVLHRDLKPANILLSRRGQVKVTDFGLAVLTVSGAHLESAFGMPAGEIRELIGSSPMLAGTPQYMAPEQWRGEADERSDVFACGEILYELLTGHAPFPVARRSAPPVLDPSFTAAAADLPPGFAPIIDKALAREPAARFQSAAELLLALSSLERRETRAAAELPYRYLEAFAEADAAWFFGREAETTGLQLLLARRPLLAVVGPSGAGKSSLVHAGLVPRLRADRAPWTILAMRPGRDPLHTVCARLGESEARDAGELLQRPARLGEWLRELAARSGGPVLLVVDQLEELYTHAVDAANRAAFAAGLLSAGDDPDGPVRVVVTVREDFLPRFADSPELEEQLAQNRVFVRPPGRPAMLEALRGPARALGVAFEAGLDEEIVDALADEKTPLPLLELTASRLWERRDERRLGRAALIQLGGVAGVMAAHAEEVLAELPAAGDIDVARRIFCELVTADRTRQHREREHLLAGGDREAAARVLEHLLRRRLLTSKQDGPGAPRIELPSEALLGGWSRLQGWLDEGLAERVFRERMQQAACLWDERGRPRELLWTGRALDEAAGRDPADLAGASRDFLAASLARRRRRRWALWSGAAGIAGLLVAIAAGSVAGMRVYGAQRDQAREFARLLLFDLRDAVEPLPGSTPALDKLVSASLAYYRSNVDPDAGDREQRRNLAVAFEKIGEVALRLGRTADARDAQERAVHIHERLVEEAPREGQPVRDLAGGHEKLGAIAAEQGRAEDAERHLARAVELRSRLAAERPRRSGGRARAGDQPLAAGGLPHPSRPYRRRPPLAGARLRPRGDAGRRRPGERGLAARAGAGAPEARRAREGGLARPGRRPLPPGARPARTAGGARRRQRDVAGGAVAELPDSLRPGAAARAARGGPCVGQPGPRHRRAAGGERSAQRRAAAVARPGAGPAGHRGARAATVRRRSVPLRGGAGDRRAHRPRRPGERELAARPVAGLQPLRRSGVRAGAPRRGRRSSGAGAGDPDAARRGRSGRPAAAARAGHRHRAAGPVGAGAAAVGRGGGAVPSRDRDPRTAERAKPGDARAAT
jgi:tetratricopeptide (TPR) repeat protein